MGIKPLWTRAASMGTLVMNQPAVASGTTTETPPATAPAATAAPAAPVPTPPASGANPAPTEAPAPTQGEQQPQTAEEWRALAQQREAELEAQKRINRNLERRSKKDLGEIERLKASGATQEQAEAAVDAEKLRETARAEARQEVSKPLVRAAVVTELAGKVQDPEYAAWLLLDKSSGGAAIDVDENYNVDRQAVTDAVAELLDKNPRLKVAAQGELTTNPGSADQGAREVAIKSEEQQLVAQLAEAQKNRDFVQSIAIRQKLAALAATPTKG